MIFRVEKNTNYTTMSNYHLRDKRISLKAKGLLSWMLSNTDNWDYSIQGIVANCKENETAIVSALDELKTYGYLQITKLTPDKTESGRFEYIYNIYEKPKQEIEKQGVEILPLEFQPLEVLRVENQVQISNNKRNTIGRKTLIEKPRKGIPNNQVSEIEIFVKLYNELCPNLPKCIKQTDNRDKAISKIVKKFSLEDIKTVFTKANDSAFLTGKNDRGWIANIDFLLREDKFISTLEGKYDGKVSAKDKISSDIDVITNRHIDRSKLKEEITNGKAEKF